MTPQRRAEIEAVLERAENRLCEQCGDGDVWFDCECDGPDYEPTGLCPGCLNDPDGPSHRSHRHVEVERVGPKLVRELLAEIDTAR